MAVTGSTLHWKGATGSHAMNEGPQYTAVYRVTSDDYTDQVQTIIAWVRSNLVELDDEYAYSGDTGSTVARCTRISAERDLGTTDTWEVTVTYASSSKEPEKGEDEDGNQTDDPTEYRARITVSTITRSKPVEKAKYLGGYNGFPHAVIGVGNEVIPMNSVLIPFNPGLEKEHQQLAITIYRNALGFVGNDAAFVTGSVNATSFTIDRSGFFLISAKHTTRITGWKADLRLENGIEFWEGGMSMIYDSDGWVDEVADRGLHASTNDGDPDGRGGIISPGDEKWEIPGFPRVRRLTDPDGLPITQPVLLNGAGQPLDVSQLGDAELPGAIVYGRWLKYREFVFQSLPYLQGIVF